MTTATGKPADERRPPLPKGVYKIVNPLMKLVLSSPLHKSMSRELMILRWTGRKSGKRFSTPVGYVREGNQVLVFTHSPWWKNFTTGAPVTMRIQGKEIRGVARLVEDPAEIKPMLLLLTKAYGEQRSRQMRLWVDNLSAVPAEAAAQAVRGTRFIRIDVQ